MTFAPTSQVATKVRALANLLVQNHDIYIASANCTQKGHIATQGIMSTRTARAVPHWHFAAMVAMGYSVYYCVRSL